MFVSHGETETAVLTTQRRHCASPYNTSLVSDGFLYLPVDRCYEVHMKVFQLPPPPFGVRTPPQSCWPFCLIAAELIRCCLLPAEQQVCDLVTWLFAGWFQSSPRELVQATPPPPQSLTTIRSLIGWTCQGGESKGLWDEIWPVEERNLV